MTAPEIDEATWNAAAEAAALGSIEAIALAILEARALQREKDAKIAESNDFWPQEGADIAAAIREI